MKVTVDGIIYQYVSNGGISRLFSELLPRMCDIDELLKIRIITEGELRGVLPKHTRISHQPLPHINHYLLPGKLWKPVLPFAKDLVRRLWIQSRENDIWHSTYYTRPASWNGLQVVTVYDLVYERFADLFQSPWDEELRKQKRDCILTADAIICISENTRKDLQHFYKINTDSTFVVPLACSDIFKKSKHSEQGLKGINRRPFILYIGDNNHHKNFKRLIQAYRAWPHHRKIALIVVGRQFSFNKDRDIVELKKKNLVSFLPSVDDQTLCHLYNQAVMLVYPSLYEGFGVPLLEAMACECPVVASCIPSTIEVAGEYPIYFEPTEADDMVRAFDIALAEGKNPERMQKGLERLKHYSWDMTARRTIDIYKKLL